MRVRITRLREDVPLPSYATEGSVAFDLTSTENLTIPAKGGALVPTGLIVATPPGFALILTARSSLYRKKGLMLANGVGTIDQDFCGPEDELKVSIWNATDKDVSVEKGERLAQGLFMKIDKAEWEEGPAQGLTRGGIGSTGGYASSNLA
jgi:dUTP pyrophosphatase